MLRDSLDHRLDTDPDFRWRGDGVSRVENLSDIVFALAFGMVVSARTPPVTFEDLQGVLFGIVPVAACFVILVVIWKYHFMFFRRYGLTSRPVLVVNAVLLFVLLYLAYPLRFAFEGFFAFVLSGFGQFERLEEMRVDFPRSGVIMAYFAVGFGTIHALMGWLHTLAWRAREALELNAVERARTRERRRFHFGFGVLAILVTAAALFTPLYGNAGFLFFLSWPLGWWAGRAVPRTTPKKVAAEMEA